MRNIRPLREEYIAIAKVVQHDLYLRLDEDQFVAEVVRNSEGNLDPKQIKQTYYRLLREARR